MRSRAEFEKGKPHTVTVETAGGSVGKSQWARCTTCGWLGPVRRGTHLGKAYDDQEKHLQKHSS